MRFCIPSRRRRSLSFATAMLLGASGLTGAACSEGDAPGAPGAPGAAGAPAGSARPAVHPVFRSVPGAAASNAPDALSLGLRIVYFSTNGVSQSDPGKMGMRRDPNGNIKDDQGGSWTATEFVGGTSGGVGYTVIDVVGRDGASLVLDQRHYLLPSGPQGPASYMGGAALRVHPTGGDFFLHPALLAKVEPVHEEGMVVFRGPFELGGAVRKTLRVTMTTHGYSSNVYDLENGLLLTSAHAYRASQGTILGDDKHFKPASVVTTGTHRFVGTRTPRLPWAAGSAPAWVASTKRLVYRGTGSAQSPGLPATTSGLTTVFTTKEVGRGWAIYDVSSAYETSPGIPVIPSTSTFASGVGSASGLFIDPAVLAKLETGQTLDRDPTIGTETSVEYVGPAPDGRAAVSILVASPLQRTQSIYDVVDGRLRHQIVTEQNPGTNITNVRDLRLVSIE